MAASDISEVRIDLRTTKTVKQTINRASELLGTTMSAFIVQQSYEAARQVMSNHQHLVLSNKDRDRFLSLLESPPKPNNALKRLLRGK